MQFYVKGTRNGSTSYSYHTGMNQETITRLLTELGTTNIHFITEEEWNSSVVPSTPSIPSALPSVTDLQAQIVALQAQVATLIAAQGK